MWTELEGEKIHSGTEVVWWCLEVGLHQVSSDQGRAQHLPASPPVSGASCQIPVVSSAKKDKTSGPHQDHKFLCWLNLLPQC